MEANCEILLIDVKQQPLYKTPYKEHLQESGLNSLMILKDSITARKLD